MNEIAGLVEVAGRLLWTLLQVAFAGAVLVALIGVMVELLAG